MVRIDFPTKGPERLAFLELLDEAVRRDVRQLLGELTLMGWTTEDIPEVVEQFSTYLCGRIDDAVVDVLLEWHGLRHFDNLQDLEDALKAADSVRLIREAFEARSQVEGSEP